MNFEHEPVLLKEVLDGLQIKEDGIYLDGTLGGAGHSGEILKKIPKGFLIGLDQDDVALSVATKRLGDIGSNFKTFHKNFVDFDEVLNILGIEKVDGILLDIGVSSYQFDEPQRGFSYRFDAPLDMRMDKGATLCAREVVNTYEERELNRIFREYGEERWAKRIAQFICDERRDTPIDTTFQLVEIIKKAVPAGARAKGGHPAKRVFQALRIEVNHELDVLNRSLERMIERLVPGGRLAVITFHSLEDRIVKEAFREAYKDCICPPGSPICTCDKKREIEIITRKPITPSREELERNRRSTSAKLRIAEKL